MEAPEWLAYELRRVGRMGFVMPPLIVAGFALLAALLDFLGIGRGQQAADLLSSVLEVYLPIAAGLVAATLVAQEPALDLHLTLRTRYRTTVLRRLALLLGWASLASFLWASTLRLTGLWAWPGPFLVAQLGWFVPLVWFIAAGTLLTVLLRSRIASGAILGFVWLFQQLLGGLLFNYEWTRPLFLFPMSVYDFQIEVVFGRYWLETWSFIGLMSAAMVLGVALLLGRNEFLASGSDA
jgi:hypothetical protein